MGDIKRTCQVRIYCPSTAEMLSHDERYYALRVNARALNDAIIDVAIDEPCASCGHRFDEHHADTCNEGGFCLVCPKEAEPHVFTFPSGAPS